MPRTGRRKFAPRVKIAVSGTMEPAMIDLLRELDDPARRRDPELEVEIEMDDEELLDPWFMLSEPRSPSSMTIRRRRSTRSASPRAPRCSTTSRR